MKTSRSGPLFTFVLLTACNLPEQFCVGDCPEALTSSGDASVSVSSQGDDAGDTTDGGPQGDTDSEPTGDADSGTPVDPPPTCDLVDTYPEPQTCLDGNVQPGEICYSLGAGIHTYPQGIYSTMLMRVDGVGDDLLVSDVAGKVTASTFAQGPDILPTDQPLWSPSIAGEVVLGGAGDFDHDGKLDFAVRVRDLEEDTIVIVRTDGAGTVISETIVDQGTGLGDPRVTDWDDDGNLDLAVSLAPGVAIEHLRVHFGDGAGNFTPLGQDGYPVLNDPYTVAAIGKDGLRDDVLLGEDEQVRMFIREPHRAEWGSGILDGEILDIASADLDGDGDGDVVALVDGPDLTREVAVTLQLPSTDSNPANIYLITKRYTVHCNALGLALADLDADGAIDIATVSPADPNSRVTILRNDGLGAFPDRLTVQLPAPADELLIADLNGDGVPELIGVSGSTNTIAIAPTVP